jgi:hypothetical protein
MNTKPAGNLWIFKWRSQNFEKWSLASSCLFVCQSTGRTTQLSLDGFSWNFIFETFFVEILQIIQILFKCDKINGYFCTFMIVPRWILLRMTNFSDKTRRENQNTQFIFFFFFFFLPRIVPDRPQMVIRLLRLACWIYKATNTHWEYVILIAFPLQHWLRECASMLRYTYVACHDLFEVAQPVCSHAIRRVAEESMFWLLAGEEIFPLFSTTFSPALVFTQSPIQ